MNGAEKLHSRQRRRRRIVDTNEQTGRRRPLCYYQTMALFLFEKEQRGEKWFEKQEMKVGVKSVTSARLSRIKCNRQKDEKKNFFPLSPKDLLRNIKEILCNLFGEETLSIKEVLFR